MVWRANDGSVDNLIKRTDKTLLAVLAFCFFPRPKDEWPLLNAALQALLASVHKYRAETGKSYDHFEIMQACVWNYAAP